MLLCEDVRKKIGSLGVIQFEAGKYIYVGSALNSLKPRITRYVKINKGLHEVLHWHIDYLLSAVSVKITKIYVIESTEHLECIVAKMVSRHGYPVPKFGSSDCKCKSHLFRVEDFDFLEKKGLSRLDQGLFDFLD